MTVVVDGQAGEGSAGGMVGAGAENGDSRPVAPGGVRVLVLDKGGHGVRSPLDGP